MVVPVGWIPNRASGRTTVLLTGFGPFPRVPVNATMLLVPAVGVAARRAFPDVRFITEILETDWTSAPRRVDQLLAMHNPDVVLHFGVSRRARGFEIETRGHNTRAPALDANGKMPDHLLVRDGGQDRLSASIPVAQIVQRLRRCGIPAFGSRSAGTYLCNATLYHVLDAAGCQGRLAGFVHVPDRLAGTQARGKLAALRAHPACPLTWPQALDGAVEIIATCLGSASRRRSQFRRRREPASISSPTPMK